MLEGKESCLTDSRTVYSAPCELHCWSWHSWVCSAPKRMHLWASFYSSEVCLKLYLLTGSSSSVWAELILVEAQHYLVPSTQHLGPSTHCCVATQKTVICSPRIFLTLYLESVLCLKLLGCYIFIQLFTTQMCARVSLLGWHWPPCLCGPLACSPVPTCTQPPGTIALASCGHGEFSKIWLHVWLAVPLWYMNLGFHMWHTSEEARLTSQSPLEEPYLRQALTGMYATFLGLGALSATVAMWVFVYSGEQVCFVFCFFF